MIEYKTGDILTEEAEALVNPVNGIGVMGRGLSLQFKRAFPDNFKAYAARCERNEMKPGHVFVFKTDATIYPRYIIDFPTKRHWRGKSRMEDVESGLASLTEAIRTHGIRSVAVPPLGSGLGGLSWSDVRENVSTGSRLLSKDSSLLSVWNCCPRFTGLSARNRLRPLTTWCSARMPGIQESSSFLNGNSRLPSTSSHKKGG